MLFSLLLIIVSAMVAYQPLQNTIYRLEIETGFPKYFQLYTRNLAFLHREIMFSAIMVTITFEYYLNQSYKRDLKQKSEEVLHYAKR